jgi:hypothetical protein
MGKIGEGRAAVAAAAADHEAQFGATRRQVVGQVIGNLSTQLASNIFKGDLEAALIHHVGESIFDDNSLDVKPYQELDEKIRSHSEEENVPVMVIQNDGGTKSTALIEVDSKNVQFRSSRRHEDDVPVGRGSQTGGVTYNTLGLVGKVSKVAGEPNTGLDANKSFAVDDTFVLSKTQEADDGMGKDNSHYSHFHDEQESIFEDNDAVILVGWSEIETYLMEAIKTSPDPLKSALSLEQLFLATGAKKAVESKAAKLAKITKTAAYFDYLVNGPKTEE